MNVTAWRKTGERATFHGRTLSAVFDAAEDMARAAIAKAKGADQ